MPRSDEEHLLIAKFLHLAVVLLTACRLPSHNVDLLESSAHLYSSSRAPRHLNFEDGHRRGVTFRQVLAIVLVLVGLLAIAGLAVTAAHRYSGVTAWSDEYGEGGIGLSIELALLSLVVFGGVALSLLMSDSFTSLFLEGGWRSYWFLVPVCVVALGVSAYNLVVAPKALADRRKVAPERVHRECVRPYLMYTPYSIILWVGLLLPVVALLAVSIRADHGEMADARRNLASSGTRVVVLADREPEAAREHVAIYGLEHQEAVDTVQSTVNRYLWVVGVFILFLIVILNTRITAAYAEEAQDSFKWLMWALLGVGVGICLFGLSRYQEMRELAITTHERLAADASNSGQLGLVVTAREELLELRKVGPVQFMRGAVVGVFGLVLFTYGLQHLLAKVGNRSAIDSIFPRRVAGFIHAFLVDEEKPAAPPQRS